jgi:hypothetical protein
MAQTGGLPAEDVDPGRFFWYGVYAVIMVVSALPLFGLRIPQLLPYLPTLVVHEFAAFLFFGHTFFSNIWSMRIRQTQPTETGVWARAMLRKLALGVTGPTSVIIPLFGLMLVESWGGLLNAPWAWDAYFAFWWMAAVSIVPDVIRYGRNRNAANPQHGMKSGAIRGMTALFLTLYIMFVMVTKSSIFHAVLVPGA